MKYSPIAQLVEHLTVNQGVPGSSPGGRAIHSSVAQWSERSPVKRGVVGSSPTWRANWTKSWVGTAPDC